MKKVIYLSLLVTSIAIFTGCKEDAELNSEVPIQESTFPDLGKVLNSSNKKDKDIVRFSIALARSLKSPAVRKFVKEEALKQFDNDYDILYEFAKIKSVSNEVLEDIIARNLSKDASVAPADPKAMLKDIIIEQPLLQIAVPINIQNWDTDQYLPLVVAKTSDYDEQKTEYLKAFDSEGNLHYIDAALEISDPIIVVGYNERLIPVMENGKWNYEDKGFLDYRKMSENSRHRITNAPSDKALEEHSARTASCVRSGLEYFTGMKFSNCTVFNNAESNANGAPEIRLVVYAAKKVVVDKNESPVVNKYYGFPRGSYTYWDWGCKTSWVTLEEPLHELGQTTWETSVNGEKLYYNFLEEDTNDQVREFSLQIEYAGLTGTGKTTSTVGTIDLGWDVVYHSDPFLPCQWYEYSTGAIKFLVGNL